jgi:hypothetical protein
MSENDKLRVQAMAKMGGWMRLGVVLTLLWTLAVLIELRIEFTGLLADTVVTKTGEPASVLKGNRFADLVPVDQKLNVRKFLSVLLVPVLSMWVLGLAWAWVRAGFRRAV